MTVALPLQSSGQVTRETFWQITHTGEAVFYYLAFLAIVVFLYGVYDRFARYAQGGCSTRPESSPPTRSSSTATWSAASCTPLSSGGS